MNTNLQKSLKTFFKSIGGQETVDKAMMLLNADDRAIACTARLIRLREIEDGREPALSREWITTSEEQTRSSFRTPEKMTIKPLLNYLHKRINPDHFMELFMEQSNDLDVVLFIRDWIKYTRRPTNDNKKAHGMLNMLDDVFESAADTLLNGGRLEVEKMSENGFAVHGHGPKCECNDEDGAKEKAGGFDELLDLLKKFVTKKKPN